MTVPLSDDVRNSYVKRAPGFLVTIRSFMPSASGLANNNGMMPGIYENFRWLNVEFPDGRKEKVPEHYLNAADLPRVRRERARIADLPTVPFCEGDTVIALGGRYCKVVNIDYLAFWEERNEEPEPGKSRPYTVLSTEGSFTAQVADDEMKLVKRGMVHAFYTGNAVDFDNAEEEAKFYHWIGHVDGVKNDKSGNYAFTRDQAISALENGEADVVFSNNHHFEPMTDDRTYHLNKFRDATVGARVRGAYMDTLDLPAPRFG